MTGDLHPRLLAAVRQRMDVARAAQEANASGTFTATMVNSTRAEVEAVGTFWRNETNPATVIRHCTRDLAVLERHAADGNYCSSCWRAFDTMDGRAHQIALDVDWPCAEITDLAAAYGIEVDG